MSPLAQFRSTYARKTAWFGALVLICLALAAAMSSAQTTGSAPFDHLKTGFALSGSHVQARCEDCHQNGIFKGTPRDCASCHVAGMRFARGNVVKPAQHVPVSTQTGCDSCHNQQRFAGARFSHAGVIAGTCATCHGVGIATGKPGNHIQTTASCDSCHRTNAWSPAASFDHAGVLPGTCATCHGAGRATGKPASHIPTTLSCDSCHKSFRSWRPTAWNHTQMVVAAQCAGCHSGAFPPADARPSNHIPYATVPVAAAANCDNCHRGGFSTWANGRFHANFTVATGCVSCHTLTPAGSFLAAVGKPATATHNGVTGNCEGCHRSTAGWRTAVSFTHLAANAVGTGTCDTCHNGTTARGRSATHVPITSATPRCDSCHRSQVAFATAVTMNHGVVTTQQCRGCHNGSYISEGAQGALAKPANHIPEVQLLGGATMDCAACHTGTVAFTTVTMNHNNSQGNGAGLCRACHAAGTNFLGSMERRAVTHVSATATDCSQSGCHRPLGVRGTPYRSW